MPATEGEGEEEFDAEAEDVVAELPPPRPKPSLDTSTVKDQAGSATSQQSTRRRWSVKAMFTPRSTYGTDSASSGSPQKLGALVEAMRVAHPRDGGGLERDPGARPRARGRPRPRPRGSPGRRQEGAAAKHLTLCVLTL